MKSCHPVWEIDYFHGSTCPLLNKEQFVTHLARLTHSDIKFYFSFVFFSAFMDEKSLRALLFLAGLLMWSLCIIIY